MIRINLKRTGADYDQFAPVYNRHWGHAFADRVWPLLERLLLAEIPAGGRILDLCCGTGQLAGTLSSLGYQVTGLDVSGEMLRFARENAPRAEFVQADARSFILPSAHCAALSTFDSLNHFSLPELAAVFRNVRTALRPDGRFLFDLNMEEGFRRRWHGSFAFIEEDHVCAVKASYDDSRHIGHYDVTIFTRGEEWRRIDLRLEENCHAEEEIRTILTETGFAGIETYEAEEDLGLRGETGRVFFRCRRA